MPNTPPSTRRARNVDTLQRDNSLLFEKASRETLAKTKHTKTFLEDYYKHLAENTPPSPVTPRSQLETSKPVVDEKKKKTLKKKIASKYRKITGGNKHDTIEITDPTSFSHTSHVGFVQGSGLQIQNLPEELQLLVGKLNSSLGKLGADNVTEDELKILLASSDFSSHLQPQTPAPQPQSQPRQDLVKAPSDSSVKPKRKLSATIAQKIGLQSSSSYPVDIQIGEPVNFVKVTGFDFGAQGSSAAKMNLELAEKALKHEIQLRKAAEDKASNLAFSLSKLQIEMDQMMAFSSILKQDNHKISELLKYNKQQEVEITMWKKRLSSVNRRNEEALDVEVQRRRALESQYADLLSQKSTDSEDIGKKTDSLFSDTQREIEMLKAQFAQEKSKMREENEKLRSDLEQLRGTQYDEKKEWEELRAKLMGDIETVKIDNLKKVEELTKRLETERKQRRVDQIMIETLSKTNTDMFSQLEGAERIESVSHSEAGSSRPPVPPPLPARSSAPPLPARSMSNTKLAGSAQSLDEAISAVKLQPVQNRDDKSKRESPQSSLDLLAIAIIARRQHLEVEEDDNKEDEESDNFCD